MPDLSIVVPVYNSSAALAELVRRIGQVVGMLDMSAELILVNDGSRDDSWQTIQSLASAYPMVRGVDLARNYGQHNAIVAGIHRAEGEIIVTMDDDLQHPPEEIPRLLERLDEGVDVVYGTPANEQHGLWRVAASQISKMVLQGAMGADTARSISAFRAFRRTAAGPFELIRSSYVNVDVLLSWGAARFATVVVRHDPRHAGSSNYTFRMLLRHALRMLIGFSTAPLRFASVVGFASLLFGFAVLAYVFGRYLLEGGSVPGFPFLASIVTIFAGAQLFSLGIIGEYLAGIHFRSMDRPVYVIRSATASESGCDRPVHGA